MFVEPARLAPFSELRAGNLGVRLAISDGELDAVQALRYRVFYNEMGAAADTETARTGRDRDAYDKVADHLIVVDHAIGAGPEGIVATYRLVQPDAAARIGHFYSADEYDIRVLERYPGRVLELGRSCVDSGYRNRAAMQLLWRGIAAYVFHYQIDVMFGCASLHGTDPEPLALELSYLYYNHLAPRALRPRALPHRYIEMRRLDPEDVDPRRALALLPPLIKG
jgi:putative hemolysin